MRSRGASPPSWSRGRAGARRARGRSRGRRRARGCSVRHCLARRVRAPLERRAAAARAWRRAATSRRGGSARRWPAGGASARKMTMSALRSLASAGGRALRPAARDARALARGAATVAGGAIRAGAAKGGATLAPAGAPVAASSPNRPKPRQPAKLRSRSKAGAPDISATCARARRRFSGQSSGRTAKVRRAARTCANWRSRSKPTRSRKVASGSPGCGASAPKAAASAGSSAPNRSSPSRLHRNRRGGAGAGSARRRGRGLRRGDLVVPRRRRDDQVIADAPAQQRQRQRPTVDIKAQRFDARRSAGARLREAGETARARAGGGEQQRFEPGKVRCAKQRRARRAKRTTRRGGRPAKTSVGAPRASRSANGDPATRAAISSGCDGGCGQRSSARVWFHGRGRTR